MASDVERAKQGDLPPRTPADHANSEVRAPTAATACRTPDSRRSERDHPPEADRTIRRTRMPTPGRCEPGTRFRIETMNREWILEIVTCPDATGVVHAVTGVLAGRGGNITESQQFSSPDSRQFFLRLQFSTAAEVTAGALETGPRRGGRPVRHDREPAAGGEEDEDPHPRVESRALPQYPPVPAFGRLSCPSTSSA